MSKKLSVQLPSDNLILIPRSLLPTLKNADGAQAKLLIWLYANPEYNAAEAAKDLGMSIAEAEKALIFWKGAGIVSEQEHKKAAAAPSESRPAYDSAVISDALQQDRQFCDMCEEFASIIGKVLNRTDYNTLFYLYDFCRLSGAYICMIAQYCMSNGKKDMRYIQKTALAILDEGIDTEEALEEYIARKERVKDDISSLRTLCGMGDRQLTTKEAAFVNTWFDTWSLPFEMIRLAYEKTVDSTGKISFSYMNKVLENWHAEGYTTAADAASKAKKAENANSSFDADEFFMAALKKSKEDDD